MVGGAGIDTVSLAQSRRVDIGVECGGTGLEGGEARDRGCKTGPGGSSGMVAAMEDGGDDETARLWSSWGEFGCTRGDGVADGEQGVSAVVGGVVNNVAVVWDVGGSETSRFWGFWCELGGWNGLWRCSGGFTFVRRCFPAVARGPGWGKAWGSAVVNDDVAIALGGLRFGTGVWGASWGELVRLGGLLGRC